MKSQNKFRLVKCPNCHAILPMDPTIPVYSCGRCLTILRVEKKKIPDNEVLLSISGKEKPTFSFDYKVKQHNENYPEEADDHLIMGGQSSYPPEEEEEHISEGGQNIYLPEEDANMIKSSRYEFSGQILESSRHSVTRSEIWSNRKKYKEAVFFRIKSKDDEIPDDGFEWREYGEKIQDVNAFGFLTQDTCPRFYIRHAAQGCQVSKTIEREEGDPSYLTITYKGYHICTSDATWMPSSECLERCLSYCLLFPPGHEFHSDSMVLLWIAEGVIDGEASERLEDRGFICLQILLCHGFIMLSGVKKGGDYIRYKVNKHEVFELYVNKGSLADEFLIIDRDGFSKFARKPLHVSLPGDRFDSQTLEALLTCKELRTLLLLGDFRYLVKQVPRDLFLSLNLLRTLDLSQTKASEFPSSVGNLEDLRYLDLSGTLIRELPGVICDLVNLQTLKLRDCSEFSALPKGTAKLTKLRHLDLDIITQLSDMPKGMGRLVNLQTLKGFIVGTDKKCSIAELSQLNDITGSFSISGLENVSNVEEYRKADLRSKTYITKLVLRWNECINAEVERTILESLLPHPNLSELHIQFYSGSVLPSWIGDSSFTNLTNITLYMCINCSSFTTIGRLPSLKFLNIFGMDKVKNLDNQGSGTQQFSPSSYKRTLQSMSHDEIDCFSYDDFQGNDRHPFFPVLEKLTVENMSRLQEWTEIGEDHFPCLHHLSIRYCPRLVELPSMSSLESLKYLELDNCSEMECLPDIPASLETLIIQDCPKLQEQCRKGEGRDWQKIARVHYIWIQHRQIYPVSGSRCS